MNDKTTESNDQPPLLGLGSSEGLGLELPEADFTLDGGQIRCYYGETVSKLLAAERERHAEEVAMLRRLVRSYEHQAHRSVNGLEFVA